MATTKRQATEQRRAAQAWEDISEVSDQSKYGTLARKLPAMIQINGLGTTIAFLQSKGKGKQGDGHTEIYDDISNWVLFELVLNNAYDDLMDAVRGENMQTYRRATAEAIEFAIWLKRYAEAKDWGSAQGDDQ